MVCFTNVLDDGNNKNENKIRWVTKTSFFFFVGFKEGSQYKRSIELHFGVGAEAEDFKKYANEEKLTPLELELRKLETVVKEIVDEMNYLKSREAKLRDTNGKV